MLNGKEIKPSDMKKFERYCNQLNKLILEIREYCPEANYYFSEDTMCLMTGPSHSQDKYGRRQDENVAETVYMPYASGGEF
ncbi:MAG: hypothetical protein WC373_11830 [Smithella sp.]